MRTEYIATATQDKKQVSCMHGTAECNGNKLQLCLQQHIPDKNNIDWFFNTLLCHANGQVSDPQHMKTCMMKQNVPADLQKKVLECNSGPQGTQLQLASAAKVAKNEVVKSCTVFIGGKQRCIRDRGTWYACDGGSSKQDFLKTICDAHTQMAGTVAGECTAEFTSSIKQP